MRDMESFDSVSQFAAIADSRVTIPYLQSMEILGLHLHDSPMYQADRNGFAKRPGDKDVGRM